MMGEFRMARVKQFPIPDGRYLVFLFCTDQYEGDLISSREGNMYWIRKEELSSVNLVDDFEELLEVMLNDNLNEFQYVIEDGKWKIVQK